MSTNIDLNAVSCLRTSRNIGEYVVHNLCDGSIHKVPWGTADWFMAIAMGSLIVFLMLMILFFLAVAVQMHRS